MNPQKQEFLKHIQDDFFEDLRIGMEGLKDFVKKAFICFGTLEVKDEGLDADGDRVLRFIDNDSAAMVVSLKGEDIPELSEEDLDMSSTLCKIYIDTKGVICGIDHGFNYFTTANKENILMAAFMIGKKVEEYVPKEEE